ncbi:MAG: polysaccharide deacetylase family protein [Hyphomicrobiales bacterium]|nr:polysaccharide deacetylase family protein [Hyphomicrobiales bacterium]
MKANGLLCLIVLLASFPGSAASIAAPCRNPAALTTSRTISIAPSDFPVVGKEQYRETLPLRDREVVLTFDDGPIRATTPRVLDALAADCVKATFFMLGANVAEAADLVRRAYDEGHTIGSHTFSHPTMSKLDTGKAAKEINLGIEAVAEALGRNRAPAPFFRAPFLAITRDIERIALSLGLMVWSIDADSLDWTFTTGEKMIERSISELERLGKGILLLHDIKPATARALPALLAQLKLRGFRIVHVVPARSEKSASSSR